MLNAGKIDNSDLTARDVHIALDIWGPDLQGLKGRTTAKKPAPIITQPIHVPQSVDQFIYVDIMFVNGIPYLVSVSDPMEYSLVTKLANKNQWTILKALRRHISEYTKFDYKVHKVYVDGESAINSSWFKQKCEVPIDVSSESVGKIERKIRVIKERLRGIINVLPFNLTQRMEGWLVYYAVSRINLQPTANSGSNLSPREKLYHRRIDYKKDLKHGVFDYVQVHMDNTDSPTYNGMQSRTQGAIALMPVGNEEGSWYYMLLSDFSVIKRNRATPLPMPDEVISYLNTHSSARKGSFSRVPQLIQGSSFSIIEDEPSEDEEEDHDFGGDLPPQYFVHEINDDVEEPNGADLLVGEFADEDEEIDRDLLEPFVFPPQPVNQPINNEELLRDIFGGDSDDENEQAHEEEDNASADGTAKNASEQASEENKKNPYGLRPRTGKNWSKYGLAALLKWRTKQRFLNRRFGLNMTVKQGIDKLGDKAIASIIKEMSQLVLDKPVWEGVDVDTLPREMLKRIITSHMFLKEKYTASGVFDKVKSRLVAGGHLQDKAIYSNGSSPTVSTQAVLMVAAIAAKEKRAVATADVQGAFLFSELPEDGEPILMRLDKYLTSVLIKLDPSYEKYVQPNGTCVVKLKRALYGCVESARQWYDTLSAQLQAMGFTKNKQDMCVFNRLEHDGTQTTIVVHVDDMMITASTEDVIDKLTNELNEVYPGLSTQRGQKLEYIGMVFDFTVQNICRITMDGYVEDLLVEYDNITGVAETPATNSLFVIKESELLDDSAREYYHSLTAKLLYLGKRVRPDILTACSFLTKRVQKPTREDMKKLERVIRYIRHTRNIGIALEADKHLTVMAYVDASYGVHQDMKSQTGCTIGIGKGPIYAKSSGQKLNTKSSTEAELVGLSDSTGQILWTRNFLIEQGYNVEAATVYQDNMSTIALVKNGKSNSERTRHIAIRFFFVADRVASKEIKVEYMQTGEMLADILTKPLQGELFRKLRDKLLNWQ